MLIEAGYYIGAAVAVGVGLVVAWLALPEPAGGVVAARLRRAAVAVAILVVVTGVLEFVADAARSRRVGIGRGFGWTVLDGYLHVAPARGGTVGAGVVGLLDLGVGLLLALSLLVVSRQAARAGAWVVVLLGLVTVAIPHMPFGQAHAQDVIRAVLIVGHVWGAMVWAGGLLALAVAGLVGRLGSVEAAEPAGEDWARVWARFGSVALGAVGVLVVSGSWLAWTHVGTPAQLFTTPYGRYLAIKLALVLVMLAAGGYNARVLLPRIAAARAAGDRAGLVRLAVRHFPKVVAAEAVLAVGVLLVVPFLAGSARSEAGWPAARAFDGTVFGTGVLLTALVAAALWAGTRTAPRRSADARESVRAA